MKQTKSSAFLSYTLPVLMGAALAAAVIWGKAQALRAKELETLADEYVGLCTSSCASSCEELLASVNEMSVSLEKLRATGSTANRVLALEDIVRGSGEAAKLICRIPGSQVDSMDLAAFLTRIGDYARSISKRLLAGGSLEERDTEQLEAMLDALRKASASMEFPVGTEEFDYYDTDREGNALEFPTLFYDGYYSEAAENAEPLGLTGEEGGEEDARRLAESLAGTPLEYSGRTEGRIPTYDFSGEGFDASITVRGLRVLYFMGTPTGSLSGAPEEGYEELAASGKKLLDSLGYSEMEPAFFEFRDGSALISYVWKTGETKVLSDVVKVWIDRGTGEPMGLDARGYLMNHRERELGVPAIDEETARGGLASSLGVTGTGLALLSTSPDTETLCYEFRGSCGDCEYIVYVNAETGSEELVLRLIRDGYGERTL